MKYSIPKFLDSDFNLRNLIKRKDFSELIIWNYITIFKEFYELFKITLFKLAKIAKKKQKLYNEKYAILCNI